MAAYEGGDGGLEVALHFKSSYSSNGGQCIEASDRMARHRPRL
ncbi:DUF397 domain-containing protein [Kitasatospora sp. NPDC091257]